MTTYYEYSNVSNSPEPDPALVVSGFRATLYWVDPTVDNIFNESGGKAVSINFAVAAGHYTAEVVVLDEDTYDDAVTAAVAYASTATPPTSGWIVGRLNVGSQAYEGMMQIAPI